MALTAFLDSFPWAEVCVLRKQITWKTLCLVFLLSRHLVSFGRSQDLCICRILCWGHWMQTGPYNSSGLTLYQSPSDISPNLGWTECSCWVRAAGCAWEPDQSPTGVNDWGMVNLKAWSSILLFYNANSMFSSAGKSAVIFLCLSENVNMKMCFSSGRFEALRPLMCPLAKGSLGLSKSRQVVIKWSVKIKQLKYQTATHLTRVSRSICSWLSFQLEKRKEHHHKSGWT